MKSQVDAKLLYAVYLLTYLLTYYNFGCLGSYNIREIKIKSTGRKLNYGVYVYYGAECMSHFSFKADNSKLICFIRSESR